MIIKRIYVRNFRNIKEAFLEFGEGCNIFYGGNAQGKTNMLEAISLCLGRSFRMAKTSAFIPFNAENNINLQIKLWYASDLYPERENVVKYEIKKDTKKAQISINDIPMKNTSDLYGELKYVVFTPEDLFLIKGAPDLRRNYLDNIAVHGNKSHKKIMSAYKNAMQQRNYLSFEITRQNGIGIYADLLKDWNDVMIKQGVNLTYGRLKFFSILKDYIRPLYAAVSENKENVGIQYLSSVWGNLSDFSELNFNEKDELYKFYSKKLENSVFSKQNDYLTGIGPHKDDILFKINENDAREFASQGQLRSVALTMKLSEAEIINDYNKEKPSILLDEVLGELDNKRREFVVRHFEKSQVFITSCNINDFKNETNIKNCIKIWEVEKGDFKICSSW